MTAFSPSKNSFSNWRYNESLKALYTEFRAAVARGELPNIDPVSGFVGWVHSRIALGDHRASAVMDRISEGLTFDTMRTRGEAVLLGNWMGRPVKGAIAASADMVLDLSSPLAGLTTLVDTLARFGTVPTKETAQVSFENLGAPITGGPTGHTEAKMSTAGVFANYVLGSNVFPAGCAIQDVFAVGNPNLMFDSIGMLYMYADVYGTVQMEYCDDGYVGEPDLITNLGVTIQADLNTYLGRTDSCAGLTLRITLKSTGIYEDRPVVYSGGTTNIITTATDLGQPIISTNEGDYEITATWLPVPNPKAIGIYDGATGSDPEMFNMTGMWAISWDSLQSLTRNWAKTTIDGVEAYWIRWRLVVLAAPAWRATVNEITDSHRDYRTIWSTILNARQGETVRDTIGTTDGTAYQRMRLNREPMIENSISALIVGTDDGWGFVDSLYDASQFQKAFTLHASMNGTNSIDFGNGEYGQMPPVGDDVVVDYRIGADVDGNVAEDTITQILQGAGMFARARNPRAASGWVIAEGSTDAGIETLRHIMPGNIRALQRAVSLADYEVLSEEWESDTGSPVARAFAVEDALGAKTVGLYVSGPGGIFVTADDRDSLEEYFNGELIGLQKVGGVGLLNSEVTCLNYVPHIIAVTATIDVIAGHAAGVEDTVTLALIAALGPLAKNIDGTWKFHSGMTVSPAYVSNIIAVATGSWLVDITVAVPGAPVVLAAGELPQCTALGIALTVVEV